MTRLALGSRGSLLPRLTDGVADLPSGGEARTGARTAAAGSRDAFFDNAKLMAIVLVVVGHSWEPLRDSRAMWAGYFLVYTFHMPVFIVISGYFSRSFAYKPHQIQRLVSGLVIPYAVFETAYSLYGNAVGGRHNAISLLSPWYLTWFLVALAVWRLIAPLWKSVRWPFTTAVVLSVLAASSHIGNDLTLDRVFQLLPFFVLGLMMRPEHWEWVRRAWVRKAAVPVFAAAAGVAYWAKPRVSAKWTTRGQDWGEMHASAQFGLFMTLGMLVAALVLCACFLSWVPGRQMWFTKLGENTLCVYLLHGFLIRTADWKGLYARPFWHTPQGELTVTFLALAVALLLATPPVRRSLRWVMDADVSWAFRRST